MKSCTSSQIRLLKIDVPHQPANRCTGANSGTVTIADNDSEQPKLVEPAKNLLSIEGGSVNSLLKFTKVAQPNSDLNEVCAFVVDDDLGQINGIKPGESGYVAAAIGRASTIFSSLGNNSSFDRQNDSNSQRYLNYTPGERLEFLAIGNETLDRVRTDLAANKPTANILFSLPSANPSNATQVKFTSNTNGTYDIAFKDITLKVEALDNVKVQGGTSMQSKLEGQVIDLRYGGGNTIVDTKTIALPITITSLLSMQSKTSAVRWLMDSNRAMWAMLKPQLKVLSSVPDSGVKSILICS